MAMSDDEGPNFSYAYSASQPPTPSVSSASWNPALRLNNSDEPSKPVENNRSDRIAQQEAHHGHSTEESDNDFFDRYPGASPEQRRTRQQLHTSELTSGARANGDEDGGREAESPLDDRAPTSLKTGTIHVEQIAPIQTTDVQRGENPWPVMEGKVDGPVSGGPVRSGAEDVERADNVHEAEEQEQRTDRDATGIVHVEDVVQEYDEETPILHPEQSAAEQDQELEKRLPHVEESSILQRAPERSVEEAGDTGLLEQEQEPAEHYEHQSRTNPMEDAAEESGEASLLESEQAAPTPGWGKTKHEHELGYDGVIVGQQQHPDVAQPTMQRAFTNNFTDTPQLQAPAQHQKERYITGDFAETPATQCPVEPQDKSLLDDDDQEFLGSPPPAPQSPERPRAQPLQLNNEQVQSNLTGGGIVASRTTAVSQVLQEMRFDKSEARATAIGAVADGAADAEPEEDLAAAWKAALDDDEFLDESAVDPSVFFEDDGEGFLDDREPMGDQSLTPSSPSMPVPVVNQQGQTTGFTTYGEQQQQRGISRTQYTPAGARPAADLRSPSTPQYNAMPSPQFFSSADVHARSAATPSSTMYGMYSVPQQQQRLQRPAPPAQSLSFADKSKGGYQSPYDLPMDIVKPRKRPIQPQHQSQQQAPAPPPRTSSFASQTRPMPLTGQQAASTTSLSPPGSSHSGGSVQPPKSTPKTDSGFFADLPMASKTRGRPSGAYTPGPSAAMPTLPLGLRQMPSQQGFARGGPPPTPPVQQQQYQPRGPVQTPMQQPNQMPPPRLSAPQAPIQPGMMAGLRQPERLPLLPDDEHVQQLPQPPPPPLKNDRYSPSTPGGSAPAASQRFPPMPPPQSAPSSTTTRYSPTPTSQPAAVQARSRYTSAPQSGPPNVQKAMPFAPRTSSPLAYQETPHPDAQRSASYQLQPEIPSESERRQSVEEGRQSYQQQMQMQHREMQQQQKPAVQPSPEHQDSSSRYAPSEMRAPDQNIGSPPQRPRTQSPSATMKAPKMGYTPIERPSSAFHQTPAPTTTNVPQPTSAQSHRPVLPHRRQFSRELPYAVPNDERAQDPLERWKGHPVFKWSAGGTVVTSFPRQTPFYGNSAIPALKCTPGTVNVQDAAALIPLDDRTVKFPGPLPTKGKGKKKELLAWMTGKIEDLQRSLEGAMLDSGMPAGLKKRADETVVLWKIAHIFLEHEGHLDGDAKVIEEVRNVILPNLALSQQVQELQTSPSATLTADAVDKSALSQLRFALLEGQREKAVWIAEEKRLWGHAMLIASTMGPETWRQIVQSFVRAEVKKFGSDARSLAALYQVFAGNAEDCVDELVPPSARAGFQMINKADGTTSGDPLAGLDQWRETLALVVSNRSANDALSLVALGKLLQGYGRVEAAHVCFLFSRAFIKLSGVDDADAHLVLLGADHVNKERAPEVGSDLDSIILTEIYEYTAAMSAPSGAVTALPYLQPYRLMHAQALAAHGHRTKAQSYCDSIVSAVKSTTRPSPYYHPAFLTTVDDLSRCLSFTPQPHGVNSTWIPKMSSDKVSGSMSKWFSNFVAGEDASDRASTGSRRSAEGNSPFGGIDGDAPTMSRSTSGTDLYSGATGYPMNGTAFAPLTDMAVASGKYGSGAPAAAAGGRYVPQENSGLAVGRSSLDSTRSYESRPDSSGLVVPGGEVQRPASARYASYIPQSQQQAQGLAIPGRPESLRGTSDYGIPYGARRGSAMEVGGISASSSYEPKPMLDQHAQSFDSYQPSPQLQAVQDEEATSNASSSYEPRANGFGAAFQQEPEHVPEGGSYNYQPPQDSSSYEPPTSSYQPYEPDAEPDSPVQKKKKSFMDDDEGDSLASRAASTKKTKADRQTDEVFRKAAEADAAKDKAADAGKKGGWFGWPFKKDPNALPGPVKAKLGEQSSFYYDEQLKKWVNKKGGSEGVTPVAATPAPPRGPPSRVASSSSGLSMSGPPSRAASVANLAQMAGSRPPTSGSAMATSMLPTSGPPSRAGTPGSNPSVTDSTDTPGLAPPLFNGLAGSASGPPSRPSKSLSTASSIDDLLAGPPGGRRGGTVKGKKKGGRYVDVMANQ